MNLFHNDGTNWYRIPSLIATPGGTLIATCDKRKGSYNDHGQDTDLVMRRSVDGGKTWAPQVTLATRQGATIHSGPSLVDARENRVFKFYKVDPCVNNHIAHFNELRDRPDHWHNWGVGNFMIQSDDDGQTWSKPRRIDIDHPDASLPARVGNSVHGIQMSDGTLLIQAYCACGTEFKYDSDMPTRAFLLISENGGKTWYSGATWSPGYACQEYVIAETTDGHVYVNHRGLGPHRRALWIDDYRCNHNTLRDEPQLPEPVCHAGMHRAGDTLWFVNPSIENHDRKYREDTRRNLVLYCSDDDGLTWQKHSQLASGPSGYADLTAFPDGRLGCLYEAGDVRYDDRIDFEVIDVR